MMLCNTIMQLLVKALIEMTVSENLLRLANSTHMIMQFCLSNVIYRKLL